MPSKSKIPDSPASLRIRAEKRLGKPDGNAVNTDSSRIRHELEVHQIELEMQNAELRIARDDAEAMLEKYTELYDFAPVGYFTLCRDGTVRLSNLTGATLLGIGRASLIGRSFGLLVAPKQRNEFNDFLKNVFADGAKHSAEFELADSHIAADIVKIEARRYSNGIEASFVMHDITERRQAQEQMRVSEIHYRRLFEAAKDGILLVDPNTCKIVDANPFMTKLLGYSREQLIGKELFQIGLLKDENASQAMFHELKISHQVRYEDLPLKSKAGRKQEVEVVANLYQEDGRSVIQCNIRDISLRKLAESVSRRNVKLEREIARRKVVEDDLKKSRKELSQLLRQSRLLQKQLRDLSRRLLVAQEDERKRISHELHDVIGQTLVGINIHLAVLTLGSASAPAALKKQIRQTRLLVEKAVNIVHNFARELRPSLLDDLGIIAALEAYVQEFIEETNIPVKLHAFADLNKATNTVRTVLYPVVQEALTNVARHSKATLVEVTIETQLKVIHMTIKDNGQGFQLNEKGGSKKKNRLGIIGMRERIEMIGGKFQIISAPGGPTTVQVEIPAP
jgi:PAS domain S-box-containing protein